MKTCATCRHHVPCSQQLDAPEPVAWCNVHGEHRTVTDRCRFHSDINPGVRQAIEIGILHLIVLVLILLVGVIWEETR